MALVEMQPERPSILKLPVLQKLSRNGSCSGRKSPAAAPQDAAAIPPEVGICCPNSSMYSPAPQTEEQSIRLLSPPGDGDSNLPELKAGVDYINIGQEDQSEVYGYKRCFWKTTLSWVFIILTGGFLRLVFHWAPKWMLKATHSKCPLAQATRVLVVEHYKKHKDSFVKDIKWLISGNVQWAPEFLDKSGWLSYVRHLIYFIFDARWEAEYSALRGQIPASKKFNGGSMKKSSITTAGMERVTRSNGNTSTKMEEINKRKNQFAIPTLTGETKYVDEIRWFSCKKLMYLWDQETETFYRLSGLDVGQTPESLHSYHGLSTREQLQRRLVYGENTIYVRVQPILRLLFIEALNPFYIFQVFSVILWYTDNYVYYATVIVVTSVISIISEVYQMHQNEVALSSTIQASDVVEVVRDSGVTENIPSEHLAPGDVIVIPPQGCMMQCDAVLLRGNTIVNESMLTGESVPVTKTPLIASTSLKFSEKEHCRHILFCGTQVIQTRFYGREKVTAVVIRTGFLTSKGLLVRSILYPPPVDFKFVQDTYKFIFVLVGIASIGFVYTVVTKAQRGIEALEIIVDSLDLITIVVPPALPMAMTIGILYALRRLKQCKIFCISPRSINISGVLNCICFDKTGTLTEDGLDMKGVVEVLSKGPKADSMGGIKSPCQIEEEGLLFGMATCHSITVISGNLVGDPLDLKMFASTGWVLEEPGMDDNSKYDMIMPSVVRPPGPENIPLDDQTEQLSVEIGILRQFPFSSSLQRMSVITRRLGDSNFSLYCKGSPEMIASLSKPESLPLDFNIVLLGYTNQGYRVLALAWKPLKISYAKAQRISREEMEEGLTFLGLLILENRVKMETTSVIKQLRSASIRTIMVTGDNMLTALSVGRECGLVNIDTPVISVKALSSHDGTPPKIVYESTSNMYRELSEKSDCVSLNVENHPYSFAIEGKSWSVIYHNFPELLQKIVVRGAIFSRMSPEQKQQLIQELQQIGYYVGMCGDGANDCGALKSAHVGISLSEAEASVASPFTSKEPNISCVPSLIREGRTALVTSFGMFKYMATYSLTQFISIMILYSIDCNLTDFQFLYIDLFLITVFAFFFGKTTSFKGNLSPKPPPHSLISLAPLLSIVLHIAHIIFFQVFCYFYVQRQEWFTPYQPNLKEDYYGSYENYAVFCISQFQYIIIAVVFSKGPPYRQPLYTNHILLISILIMTVCSIYLTVYQSQWLVDVFKMIIPPLDNPDAFFFCWQIIIFACINSIIAVMVEVLIIDYLIHTKLKLKSSIDTSSKKYLAIESLLNENKKWPFLPENIDGKNGEPGKKELNLNVKKLPNASSTDQKVSSSSPSVKVLSITQYHSSL